MYIAAVPPPSAIWITGSSEACGSWLRSLLTLAEISVRASFGSLSRRRLTVIVATPWAVLEVMKSMPSADAISRSSGVVMKPSISSASAPG
jgi:type IV pilus biogenesis protein CpaD/CtpE